MTEHSGILYLVATPIGNLEDITLRALRILKEVDRIAAEDTRHSGQLLKHFHIETPQISYHTHNAAQRIPTLIEVLQSGQSIALITDAGTPGISDPGQRLVQACIAERIPVITIPGATAAITALVASGLPTDRFIFEGFLPTQTSERIQRLELIKSEARTVILYEAPHRLVRTLTDLAEVLNPDRTIVLARELTKRFEEFWRGSVHDALQHYSERTPKGEFTLVVEGSWPEENGSWSDDDVLVQMQQAMAAGASRSQASRQVAQSSGRDRREIYQLSLDHSESLGQSRD